MSIVKILTSDGVIWNRDQVIIDLITAANHGNVVVDLLHEGPCCDTLGLDHMLDKVVASTGIDRSNVTILTSNQISSSTYQEKRLGFVELQLAKEIGIKHQFMPSTLNKLFGIFVGRSNWARLGLASYVFTKYNTQTNMTFHYDPKLDFFKENFGIEQLLVKQWNQCHDVIEFLEHLPIKNSNETYPILWNKAAFNLNDQYQDIFCEIVCETFFSGRVFFFTEKLMRCIINQRPFIVQGPQYFLSNLKKLGFKTFDQWWDEGYSDDCPDAMFNSIRQNIDWIAEQSWDTIENWYIEMQPVLEHNFHTLMNLQNSKIISTKFNFYD